MRKIAASAAATLLAGSGGRVFAWIQRGDSPPAAADSLTWLGQAARLLALPDGDSSLRHSAVRIAVLRTITPLLRRHFH